MNKKKESQIAGAGQQSSKSKWAPQYYQRPVYGKAGGLASAEVDSRSSGLVHQAYADEYKPASKLHKGAQMTLDDTRNASDYRNRQGEYGCIGSHGPQAHGSLTQRLSYFQSEDSFKSAQVSGRNNPQREYSTINGQQSASGELPKKQVVFAGYKRSVQVPPGQRMDMIKPLANGPAQTYWQFKREGPPPGGHFKSSSSDLGMQPRQASTGAESLQGLAADVGFQHTDRGPVTYQRAGALASPQSQFGPKRLTTQKQSALSTSGDQRGAAQQQPYLAHLRGQKSVNNYQSQKSALGQTIDDLDAQGATRQEPSPASPRRQGPRTGMRPGVQPLGPALSKAHRLTTERLSTGGGGWASARQGEHPALADRPSEVREEEQPYYMRAPFGVIRANQEREREDKGAAAGREQAAAHYGLLQYPQPGATPRGKGLSRPGTGLGGGFGIRKLSKLDAKEQDDVNEVTEDEDRASPLLPYTAGKPESQQAQPREQYTTQQSVAPFHKVEHPELQRPSMRESSGENYLPVSQSRKACTFGQPHTDSGGPQAQHQLAKASNQGAYEQNVQGRAPTEDQEDVSQQLRQEYLKVRRELEMLKRSGRQKMKSPVPAAINGPNGQGARLGLQRHATQQIRQDDDSNDEIIDRPGGKQASSGEREPSEEGVLPEDNQRGITDKQEHDWRRARPEAELQDDGPWQGRVEEKIGKLHLKLSDYYQRAQAEDTDARPVGEQTGSDGFRGSFSRSTSAHKFLAATVPEQADKNKQYQYRNSMTSSQNSGTQRSANLNSPLRSLSRATPKGPNQHQQPKATRGAAPGHGLYSAAGARPGSQSGRQVSRKGSAGTGTASGMSKSLKSTQNQTSKAGKGTLSYKEVEVVEINDSQEAPSGTASAGGLGGQASGRPTFSQASQSGAPAKRQLVQRKGKTRGAATHHTSATAKSRREAQKMMKSSQQHDRRLAEDGGEFRGSFQNKGHRLWAPAAIEETPGGPPSKQKASKKHPLNVKSFNSDCSIGSDAGDGYDRRGPEYSASASNNSEDNRSAGGNQGADADEVTSDEQEQSMIGAQYSQIVNIRTKHRQGARKTQKAKSSQRAKRRRKHSEERVNDKNDRRWPVATIDLESGRRTGRGATPEYVRRQRKSARDSSQPPPATDQAQVILDCQRQIQELQAQLQNLTHFPTGDTSQGSMLMMNPRVSSLPHSSMGAGPTTLQDSHRLMQGHQFNGGVPMSTPSPLQFAPTAMHMGLPANNLLGPAALSYPTQNPHHLHPGQQMQMQAPTHAGEREQYEIRIGQLQALLREQQLRLQLQEQQHEQALRTQRTMSGQPTADVGDWAMAGLAASPRRGEPSAAGALQSPSDALHVHIGHNYQPGGQLGAFTAPLTPVAPGQPPVAGSGSQIGPAPDSSVTQNHSNFFSQIKEIAKNIEERGPDPRGGSLGSSVSLDDAAGQGRCRRLGSPAERYDELQDHDGQVEVHHVTDLETTELDARRIGNSDRPEGFDGFETSVLDNQPREPGPSMPEKGSFAPLPEFAEQSQKYDPNHGRNASNIDRHEDEGRGRELGSDLALQVSNTRKPELSPDFAEPKATSGIQWLRGPAESKAKEEAVMSESIEGKTSTAGKEFQEDYGKAEQLLVIGFDEKPKGVNPLSRLKSPGRAAHFTERNRWNPHGNFPVSKAGTHIGSKGSAPRVALEITRSSGLSNPPLATPKGLAASQGGSAVSATAQERARKKQEDSEILNQDGTQSLQEYARQRTGRARKQGGNCSSPQPRRSSAFRRGQVTSQAAGLAGNPFQHRGEKSQPPKPREHKTKQELARIRREMMRTKFRDRDGPLQTKTTGRDTALETSSGFVLTTSGHMDTEPNSTTIRMPKADHPRSELLTRLASGTKAKVDLQAMRRLTKGNYEKLPEILKKKEDAKRQEELAVKKARAAAYQKQLDARLRSGMKKRRDKEEKEKDRDIHKKK